MPKHLLVICDGCGFTADQAEHEGLTGGVHLLNQLRPLYDSWSRKAELELQTDGCLCACDRPCAIALTASNKLTYLFGDLPPLDCAADLLTLCELYLDSEDGYILPANMPKLFRPRRFARIPPAPTVPY